MSAEYALLLAQAWAPWESWEPWEWSPGWGDGYTGALEACIADYGILTNIISYDPELGGCMCKIGSWETQACASITNQDITQALCAPQYGSSDVISGSVWNPTQRQCVCSAWTMTWANGALVCIATPYDDFGINCSPSAILRGECTWNVNKTLGLPDNKWMTNPTQIVSDLVLGATWFVGTALVIALIVMGVKYVAGGVSESAAWDLKANMKKLLIGLLLVVWSFTIIRLIQYIARGF